MREAPSLKAGEAASKDANGGQKRRLPTAQELIAHYESRGMESREASVKVIEDLQKALLRAVASGRGKNKVEVDGRRKLDAVNSRLLRLEMKIDSKPGFGEALAIGVASGAFLRGVEAVFPHVVGGLGQIWNAVRSFTSSLHK